MWTGAKTTPKLYPLQKGSTKEAPPWNGQQKSLEGLTWYYFHLQEHSLVKVVTHLLRPLFPNIYDTYDNLFSQFQHNFFPFCIIQPLFCHINVLTLFVISLLHFCCLRGAFGKFLTWYFISVTDLQTLSCLVSF